MDQSATHTELKKPIIARYVPKMFMRSSGDLRNRFCWREHVEPINWRLISSININKIIAESDTASLEPLSLHLTFCKLPQSETSLSHGRAQVQDEGRANLWIIIRILQLSLEYIFYLRSQDAIHLDQMMCQIQEQEQEKQCLQDFAMKKKFACKKLRQEKKQFHQVMQHICVLLEANGSNPDIFQAIERVILNRFVNYSSTKDRIEKQEMKHNQDEEVFTSNRHVKNTQQCEICGKVFRPGNYLTQHMMRRHSSSKTSRIKTNQNEEDIIVNEGSIRNHQNLDSNKLDDIFQRLLQRIEKITQEKMDTIQRAATKASEKFNQVNEMLLNEQNDIAHKKSILDDLDAKVMAATHELQEVANKRANLATEVEDFTQQIEFLELRKSLLKKENLLPDRFPASQSDTKIELLHAESNSAEEKLNQFESMVNRLQEDLTASKLQTTIALGQKDVLLAELEQFRAQEAERQAQVNQVVPYTENGNDTAKSFVADASTQTIYEFMTTYEKSVQVGDALAQLEVREDAVMSFGSSSDSETDPQAKDDIEVGLIDVSSNSLEIVVPYANDTDGSPSTSCYDNVSPIKAKQVSDDEIEAGIFLTKSNVNLEGSVSRKLSSDQTARILKVLNSMEEKVSEHAAPNKELQLRDRMHEWESTVNERLHFQCMNASMDAAWRISSKQSADLQRLHHTQLEYLSSTVLGKMSDCERRLEEIVAKSNRGSYK